MSETQPEKKPNILTDRVRVVVDGIVTPIGNTLHRLGVHPDTVTVCGLLVVAAAAVLIALGRMQVAALVLLLGLPLDAIDGAVARAMQRTDKFGAVLDSTLDRYADGFIFGALSYYFAGQGRLTMLLLAQAALLGSLMVSYIRARAGGIRVDTRVGLFTRMERLAVIIVMLLLPFLLDWGDTAAGNWHPFHGHAALMVHPSYIEK